MRARRSAGATGSPRFGRSSSSASWIEIVAERELPGAHVVQTEALEVAVGENGVSRSGCPRSVFRRRDRLHGDGEPTLAKDLAGELTPARASRVSDVVQPEQIRRASRTPALEKRDALDGEGQCRRRRHALV